MFHSFTPFYSFSPHFLLHSPTDASAPSPLEAKRKIVFGLFYLVLMPLCAPKYPKAGFFLMGAFAGLFAYCLVCYLTLHCSPHTSLGEALCSWISRCSLNSPSPHSWCKIHSAGAESLGWGPLKPTNSRSSDHSTLGPFLGQASPGSLSWLEGTNLSAPTPLTP